MKLFPPLPHRDAPIVLILVAAMICWASASPAQSTPPPVQPVQLSGDTIRLTDEERKAAEDSATVESAALARGEMAGSDRAALGVHGEVGAMVGSNGTRAVYGTAAIPLGQNAGAVVSFESSRFRSRR